MSRFSWDSMETFFKNSPSRKAYNTGSSSGSSSSSNTGGNTNSSSSGRVDLPIAANDMEIYKEINRLAAESKDENLPILERVGREKKIASLMLDRINNSHRSRIIKDLPQWRPILRATTDIPIKVPKVYTELNYVMCRNSKGEWKVHIVQLYVYAYPGLEMEDVSWTMLEIARDLFARGELRSDPIEFDGSQGYPGLRGAFGQVCFGTQTAFKIFDVRRWE
jgi:hypothetical protein